MATRPERHVAIPRHSNAHLVREIGEAGIVAGLLGGAAMALFATVYAAGAGLGFWTPVKTIAATVIGTHALEMNTASAVAIGVSIHLFVSMLFGVAFALTTPREVAPAPAIAFGAFAGVAILVVMTLVVLPLVNPTLRASLMWGSSPEAVPVWVAFAMHLVYGAGLALAPGLRRRFSADRLHPW